MRLSIIVAMSENRVIGRGGGLPWHLPDDLKHFKKTTEGHPVIMGRKTFDSIGRTPLPGRTNIIVTRQRGYEVPAASGTLVAHDFDEALAAAAGHDGGDAFILGGAELFRLALPRADGLYLTLVHATIDGDVYFPEVDFKRWKLVEDRFHEADDRHAYAFSIRVYERTEPDRGSAVATPRADS